MAVETDQSLTPLASIVLTPGTNQPRGYIGVWNLPQAGQVYEGNGYIG
jgi:hypothetical protein